MATDKYSLRKMTDEQLNVFVGGWKPGTEGYVAGMREIRRREGRSMARLTWLAIAIATLSLLLSVFL